MSHRPSKPSFNANNVPVGARRPAAGSDSDDTSESDESDETEDEDGEELTPVMDAAILRTLARIRRGEGVEEGRNVFDEETAALRLASNAPSTNPTKKPKSTKPFLLSDFQRQALLDSSSAAGPSELQPMRPTHAEEQEALRLETLNAFKVDYGDAGDDESGGLFSVRKDGPAGDEDMEDEEYRAFLLGSGGGEEGIREALGLGKKGPDHDHADDAEAEGEASADDEDDVGDKADGEGGEPVEGAEGEKKKRKRVKRKPKVKVPMTEEEKKQKDEEFLLDYILNRGWIDRSADYVPSYNEITTKPKKAKKPAEDNSDLSADEGAAVDDAGFDDKADEFETKYNFRFEEPGAANIPTHPRKLTAIARRPDTARKDARELRKEKKAEEKAIREEERRKMKGEKRREMEKRLLMLGLGKDGKELTMDDLDLDADFDEAAHDQKIAALFESGNDWGDDDGEKPTWDDEFGGDEGYEYGMEEGEAAGEGEAAEAYGDMDEDEYPEDAPINMDADFMDEPATSSKKDKKKKKKSKKNKAAGEDEADDAPVASTSGGGADLDQPFVGTAEEKKAKAEEIMDEYYALDHEDMIGTMPTRFHYTKTTPQTYGLTPAEILMATDTELNTFLGVKQYAAYRADGGAGAGRTGREKRLWELRKALKGRAWGEETDLKGKKKWDNKKNGNEATGANGEKVAGKKRKGKKERTREKLAGGGDDGAAAGGDDESPAKKRKVE